MDEMTRARFTALAEAFGGQVARWPLAEREAAAVLMAADPDFAARTLEAANGLDEALAQWPPMAVRPALREAVIAAAPRPRGAGWSWAVRFGLGAGLACACAAGLAVGVLILSAPAEPGRSEVIAAMSGVEGGGDAAGLAGDV